MSPTFSTRKAVRHLLSAFDAATGAQRENGARWYADARQNAQDMQALFGLPVEVNAAILAHTSPQTRWIDNVEQAFAIAEDSSRRPRGCMRGNYDRARSAIVAYYGGRDPLSTFSAKAHKTRAFAQAIVNGGTGDAVVIDVHMLRVIMQGPSYRFRDGKGPDLAKVIKRVGIYEACANAVRIAARRRGVLPCTMQAVCWLVVTENRAL